jgi:hypothetical protein
VQTVGLTWQHAGETAAVLAVVGGALALSKHPRARAVGALLRETATIGVLYGLWQLAGQLAGSRQQGAFARARWIEDFERHLPIPSERSAQHLILGHKLVVEGANLYYAAMHFTVMLGFLLWLFLRHRAHYRPIRQVMAWTTLGCLLVQLVPVAPPRMMPGFVDTGIAYNQSVYSNGLAIDQLSAMPSVHVAWAVLVGYYVWKVSPSRWRWIGPLHAALVVYVVAATANHWWLDGIVAVLLLAIAAWCVYGVRVAWNALVVTRLLQRADRPAVDGDRAAGEIAGSGGQDEGGDPAELGRVPEPA